MQGPILPAALHTYISIIGCNKSADSNTWASDFDTWIKSLMPIRWCKHNFSSLPELLIFCLWVGWQNFFSDLDREGCAIKHFLSKVASHWHNESSEFSHFVMGLLLTIPVVQLSRWQRWLVSLLSGWSVGRSITMDWKDYRGTINLAWRMSPNFWLSPNFSSRTTSRINFGLQYDS